MCVDDALIVGMQLDVFYIFYDKVTVQSMHYKMHVRINTVTLIAYPTI